MRRAGRRRLQRTPAHGGRHKKRLTALYRHLKGDTSAVLPFESQVDVICEQFGCLPSEAMRELDILPIGFLDDVLAARRFRNTYAALEQAKGDQKRTGELYDSPMGQWLLTIEADQARAQLAARRGH